jgi:hypothetical protein
MYIIGRCTVPPIFGDIGTISDISLEVFKLKIVKLRGFFFWQIWRYWAGDIAPPVKTLILLGVLQ